jgi:hypothetical protein
MKVVHTKIKACCGGKKGRRSYLEEFYIVAKAA